MLLVSPGAAAGRREAWRSINGSAANCRGQQQRQEGSSLAKRPRHPAPPPPPIRHSFANKENDRPPAETARRDEAATRAPPVETSQEMGANLSRHNGKGLNGRRAQSSGNLCDSKGISVGKILVPCSRSSRERLVGFHSNCSNTFQMLFSILKFKELTGDGKYYKKIEHWKRDHRGRVTRKTRVRHHVYIGSP